MDLNVKISNEPYDFFTDPIVTRKYLNADYVSDGIGNEYLQWKRQNPVLISAQTGKGKNTFVEKVILTHCFEEGKKLLIISNRIANNRQLKVRIASLSGCEEYLEDYTQKGLDKVEQFNNVMIVSYQKLETYLYDIFQVRKFELFDYVIIDEAHYFITDSLFSNNTGKIFNKIFQVFKNSIRVFMTSTPDEIFPLIIEKEKKIGLSKADTIYYSNHYVEAALFQKEVIIYDFHRDYNYVCPKYFANKKELLALINEDSSDDKWLIFVSNKADGENFVNLIGPDCVFVSAESKNSKGKDGKIYSEIIHQENFSCKVLVCTSVMDNGVNFKDDLLKNIVVFTYDKTEFIQMLGRKRVKKDEKVNLFLYSRKASDFNSKLFMIKKQIQAIYLYRSSPSMFLNQYYTDTTSNFELIKNFFNFNKKGEICINELAEKKLYNNLKFFQSLIEKYTPTDNNPFIYEQLSWLGLSKSYNDSLYISYISSDEAEASLIRFLNDYCNKPMSRDEFLSFGGEFKKLYTELYGRQINNRPERIYKETKMRKIFEKHKLSYCIDVLKQIYTLRKT